MMKAERIQVAVEDEFRRLRLKHPALSPWDALRRGAKKPPSAEALLEMAKANVAKRMKQTGR